MRTFPSFDSILTEHSHKFCIIASKILQGAKFATCVAIGLPSDLWGSAPILAFRAEAHTVPKPGASRAQDEGSSNFNHLTLVRGLELFEDHVHDQNEQR